MTVPISVTQNSLLLALAGDALTEIENQSERAFVGNLSKVETVARLCGRRVNSTHSVTPALVVQ